MKKKKKYKKYALIYKGNEHSLIPFTKGKLYLEYGHSEGGWFSVIGDDGISCVIETSKFEFVKLTKALLILYGAEYES